MRDSSTRFRLAVTAVFAALFFISAPVAAAHVPVLIREASPSAAVLIDDPELSTAFYGTLTGFPHTYEIRSSEPFLLHVEVREPDVSDARDNVSGIIVMERPEGGRVEEVARLSSPAPWPSEFEFWGGDRYRVGPTFEREVRSGTYRIEVSTPDNDGARYVLVVGTREELTLGYGELLGRIGDVKAFFGKSRIALVESPFAYVPVLIALSVLIFFVVRRRLLIA